MEHFTPLSAAIGGALIGLAATILWAFNGRTAGVSGVFGGLYPPRQGDVWWRLAFLVGLPVGAVIGANVAPRVLAEVATTLPAVDLPVIGMVVAGLLVGIGTRLGRGCTSGHGICGLARLSRRSFVAVAIFMATAIATVFITRHVI
ncbi:MAG TPA: YeeE/YedE family protein [Bauldia sp.]|nr:YeeE/YedE family protein [Bauldia sp.]